MIRKESIVFFVPFLLLGWLFVVFQHHILAGLSFFVVLFIIYFFRDPERTVPVPSEGIMVSPADGTIIANQPLSKEEAALWQVPVDTRKISIFMSVMNVHVNRAPISGRIVCIAHKPGKKIPAYHEKSSIENEHMDIVLSGKEGVVCFRLIAGLVARRIVAFKEEDDRVEVGERIGMIKFGSRVDMIVPEGWDICVNYKDKVTAAKTVIARQKTP